MPSRDPFWRRATRAAYEGTPLANQCSYVHPNGVQCCQAVSEEHGEGRWCWSHRKVRADGRRGAGPRCRRKKKRTKMDAKETLRHEYAVRKVKDERVLTHLTDAAQAISPCPDNGSVFPASTDLACGFRAIHGRWPVWWEMAKMMQNGGVLE